MEKTWPEQFYRYLEIEKRYSPHTLNAYRRDLKDFISFCDRGNLASLVDISAHNIRQYIADTNKRKLSAKTIQRRLSVVRSFFRYLEKESHLTSNPAEVVKAPKVPRHLPKAIDVDQVQVLLNISDTDELAIRDIAMLELFYSSGLRLSELVSLNISDLELQEKQIRVTGKGNKMRITPVGKYAVKALQRWFELRKQWVDENEQAVFVTQKGTRISQRSVQARLKAWGEKQMLNSGLHPHRLRHSFASHLLESSGDIRAVQELLGHENLSSTQIYTHLDFQYLAKVYDSAHPRAKKTK